MNKKQSKKEVLGLMDLCIDGGNESSDTHWKSVYFLRAIAIGVRELVKRGR